MQFTISVLFLQVVAVLFILEAFAALFLRWFTNKKIKAEAETIPHQTFRREFLKNFKNPFGWGRIIGRSLFALAYCVAITTVINQ